MVEKSKCRLSTFEGDVCPYVEKAKEEGRLQGSINMLEFFLNFYNDGKVRKRISISTSYLEKRLSELKKVV
jgi:hypothetical protein